MSEAHGWQPIETAPRDGRLLDLWVPGEFFGRMADCFWGTPDHCCGEAGVYCDSDWHRLEPGWIVSALNAPVDAEPTHWMPLPDPPSVKEAARDE